MSLSTIEAEYRAATMVAQESTWLMQLLKDLHQPTKYAPPLYCDNLSIVCLVENPIFLTRTKHVEAHYHFIRENVLQEEIALHVKTENQVANLFTKGQSSNKLESFYQQLDMVKRMEAGVEGEC